MVFTLYICLYVLIIIIIIIIIMGDLYSAFHSTRRFTKISIHSWRNIFKETSFKHSK